MRTLQALGWNWRTDGVEVCAVVDGQRFEVFVPLHKVWHEFAKELHANGTPLPPSVGGAITVAGLFDGIACAGRTPAVGWFGSSIVHAVTKAASTITKAALKPVAGVVTAGTHALSSVPIFGKALAAATTGLTSPLLAVNALANGGRIDRVVMNALQSNISSMRTLAPWVQTVVSVVPGVGQGLSGAIGAGLALSQGMSVTDAMIAAARDSLPGGPVARAAFDAAHAIASGKSLSQAALAALPIPDAQKRVFVQGVALAKDLAAGKNVSHALVDAALQQLPPEAQKAAQIALALAHAKSLQQVAGVAAQASGLGQQIANGIAATQHLAQLPPSIRAPTQLLAAVQSGLQAKQLVQRAASAAAQGHAPSSQFLSLLPRVMPQPAPSLAAAYSAYASKPHIAGPIGGGRAFVARFHTGPSHPHHAAAVAANRRKLPAHGGIHARHSVGLSVSGPATMKAFTARFHTEPATVSGIGGRFAVAGPFGHQGAFSFPSRVVRQLKPARMPYQTAPRLHYAYGR